MRTCAEILAIVETSPVWPTYRGDGASVPWQDLPWPLQQLGYAYKLYLDALSPEAFRLHDFLYGASYGLGITREEADNCLFLDLLPLDPVNAQIVYVACRVGGGPNFLPFPAPQLNAHNRGLVFGDGHMPTYKVTMLFQQATNTGGLANPPVRRLAGWSESVYINTSSITSLLQYLFGPGSGSRGPICPARAALLPGAASMVGQRVQLVPPAGASQSLGRQFPGNTFFASDIPSMGLLCNVIPAGETKVRRITLRGIPDSQVVEGEFSPVQRYTDALNAYFESLRNTAVRGRDAGTPAFPVNNVTGLGLLTCNALIPFAVNDFVQVTGAIDGLQKKRSGVFRVTNTIPLTFQVQLQGWPFGVCTGGVVKANAFAFSDIGEGQFNVGRIVTRKVGAPFARFVGRRSKRKKVA